MTWLAGVDGCPSGWFRICRNSRTGELRSDVLANSAGLLSVEPSPAVLAIDIPIGLPRSCDRACDKAARRLLGPRRSSVFPVLVRPALHARDREDASSITHQIDGRRVGVQSWAIASSIREVDETLAASARARERFWEVHPEVSFHAWNGMRPMSASKKQRSGLAQRLELARQWLGGEVLARARDGYSKKQLADDDVLDAIACLWTAHRIARGEARTLPEEPPTDSADLPMRIVY